MEAGSHSEGRQRGEVHSGGTDVRSRNRGQDGRDFIFCNGRRKVFAGRGQGKSVEVNLFESASSSGSRGSEAGCVHQDQVGRRRSALCHCLRGSSRRFIEEKDTFNGRKQRLRGSGEFRGGRQSSGDAGESAKARAREGYRLRRSRTKQQRETQAVSYVARKDGGKGRYWNQLRADAFAIPGIKRIGTCKDRSTSTDFAHLGGSQETRIRMFCQQAATRTRHLVGKGVQERL